MIYKNIERKINLLEILLVFLAAFGLIFSFIPKSAQVLFLSGGNSFKLSWYFLMMLSGIWIYQLKKEGNYFSEEEHIFIKYIGLIILVFLSSNIMGLLIFPYYSDLFNGPSSQINKLPQILSLLNKYGIDINEKKIIIVWITIRAIKGVLLDVLYSFGFAFILYDIYKKKWTVFFNLLKNAVIVSVTILCCYSLIEILYLAGNIAAKEILIIINPYIHPIAISNGWWPPLLWGGQLRSVFPEPSNMGNYLAFAIPFLWAHLFLSPKINIPVIILTTFYTTMIFLTRARTAVLIYIVLFGLLVIFSLYIRNFIIKKKILIVFAISLVAFCSSLLLINNCINNNTIDENVAVTEYIEDNIGSIINPSKRSNGARFALIRSNFKTGLSHPFFGVGNLLNSAYTIHNLDINALQNAEVKLWINHYNNEGVLKYGIDAMNEYVTRFAVNGVVGLIVYMFPFFYIVSKLIKTIKKVDKEKQLYIMFVLMGIIGTVIAGCNGSLNAFYTYWMILPLGYAIKYGK